MENNRFDEIKSIIDHCLSNGCSYINIYYSPDGGYSVSVYPNLNNDADASEDME